MKFEWDKRKHGVPFEEAATIFGDSPAVTFPDPDHSLDEDRYITFGISRMGRLLAASHVDRTNGTRIISPRLMTRQERMIYEED